MTNDAVVRISFLWVLVVLAGIFLVGAAGGFLAAWWQEPRVPILPNSSDRLVTTIQEVTVSPNTAIADIVRQHERSVVLLSRASQSTSPFASGVVVTSDGVVATVAKLPDGDLVMVDGSGRAASLERVGQDILYGITYLRANSGVFVPMEVRDSIAPIGSDLVLLTRTPEALTPQARHYIAEEYRLPGSGESVGLQQLIRGTRYSDAALAGSALLDDEGKIAALLLPGSEGLSLPSPFLQKSLQRLAQHQLEIQPFAQRGLAISYGFVSSADGTRTFALTVTAVTPASPASIQGLRAGDSIESMNGAQLSWDKSVVDMLSTKEPITLQVRRGETVRTISL